MKNQKKLVSALFSLCQEYGYSPAEGEEHADFLGRVLPEIAGELRPEKKLTPQEVGFFQMTDKAIGLLYQDLGYDGADNGMYTDDDQVVHHVAGGEHFKRSAEIMAQRLGGRAIDFSNLTDLVEKMELFRKENPDVPIDSIMVMDHGNNVNGQEFGNEYAYYPVSDKAANDYYESLAKRIGKLTRDVWFMGCNVGEAENFNKGFARASGAVVTASSYSVYHSPSGPLAGTWFQRNIRGTSWRQFRPQ